MKRIADPGSDLKRLKKTQDILGEIHDLQNITNNIENYKKKSIYKITQRKINYINLEKFEKAERFTHIMEAEKKYWKQLINRC